MKPLKIALALGALALTSQAMAQITFYEHDGWRGRTFAANGPVDNFQSAGFNDRASSVVVDGGRWEVCTDAYFRGRCVVLKPGSYQSLSGMGMNDRISSVRPVGHRDHYDNEAPPPLPQATYEYRRRPQEEVIEVPVTSVHAVVGPPEQRCWIDREQVTEPSRNNGAGTVVGAILGGVLGHQIGGGSGRQVATAGGAIAGAVIGSNAGGGSTTYDRDVRRCDHVASQAPAYWDVTYNYRGVEHHVQLASAPGNTIPVNRDGEPRM
jgi:uncharacterized protein YcfJ